MTYKAQLYPWCIIRPFPNMRTQIVGRFRNRSDAEGHLRVLKRLMPNASYQIMFDITPESSDSEDLTSPTGLPYKGRGERNLDAPIRTSCRYSSGERFANANAGEGLRESSTEE
jgi:hypothetical protein